MRLMAFVMLVFTLPTLLLAQAGVAPKTLFDPASPAASSQVAISGGPDQVSTSIDRTLRVTMKAGDAPWPGISIKPEDGKPWNLGLYGHVEAKVTNIGTKRVNLSLRVDNIAPGVKDPFNSEGKVIEPGQTKTLRVYFGHSYGYRPGYKLDPQAVTQLLFFTGKLADDVAFQVERIQGAGWPGEQIGVDPDRVAKKPAGGILLDPNTPITPAQLGAAGNAKAAIESKLLHLTFTGGKDDAVTLRPAEGLWNLNEHVQVKIKLKNTGQSSITPSIRVDSESGPTDTASAPIPPGAESEITIPFAAKIPWRGEVSPAQLDFNGKGPWKAQPGTGNDYRSNVTTGITFTSDQPGTLLVSSIVAGCPELKLPEWLGERPPVEGEWTQTLNEEFDGTTIDLHRWNIYSGNWWDKRMHFSKDQVLVNSGMLTLRLEKKPGHHNDDPKGAYTDYAAGQPDTFGKWTQRYGYFEIRQKQPKAKCCWPGFWMMPDRGAGHPNRGSTADGGMEFDITESQSSWGIHRFNVACHWDNYGKEHKAIGTSSNYVQADKDGFITVGMLWLPGSVVFYGNGKEIARWDSPRVCNQQMHLILQNEIGGWDNEEIDDAQLPADYVVDYIRVWQRKDLATPEDGPKPNAGTPNIREAAAK